MSATSQHLIPKLRFLEFSDSWEDHKLAEIAKITKGKGISKDDISEDGDIECIRYGELYTHYSETIRNIKSKTNIDKCNLVLSKSNDIIIPASGETHIDIATASCVLQDGVALGGDLNIIRTNNNGIFFSYYLNSNKKIDIARLAQGVSVVHLYPSQLQSLNLTLPSLPEQAKIASFLTAVDEKIQSLTDLKTAREQYKKGMMQKIFSQHIRFHDENGNEFPEWEDKKLGLIAQIKTGNLNVEDAINDGDFVFFDRSEEIKKYNKYSFDNEALIYAGEGSKFLPRYFNGKYGLHQRSYTIFNVKDIYMKYLYYFMLTQNNHFLKFAVGSTVKSLRMDCFEKCIIKSPSLSEQEKIAAFLSSLDQKITELDVQIEQAKQWKKGLLQGLFI